MNEIEFALHEVKLALDREIENLEQAAIQTWDLVEVCLIDSKIAGIEIARNYIMRKIECWHVP